MNLRAAVKSCERAIHAYEAEGWMITSILPGAYEAISPLGNKYQLYSLHHHLRGDDGFGNFFKKPADIAEADGPALTLASVVWSHYMLTQGNHKLLAHVARQVTKR